MILIWNPGSSSLKYRLFNLKKKKLILIKSGSCNRIGEDVENHQDACKQLMNEIGDNKKEITKVGIRIAHSGGLVKDGEKVTTAMLSKLKEVSKLAPLHNPNAIETINASQKILTSISHFAYFDTTFFENLPQESKTLALPKEITEKYGIKKFGFHGISHQYAYNNSKLRKTDKTVSIHLGAGCSATAICNGSPQETSMSFTPLDGLIMESRSGAIDPGVVLYLSKKLGIEETEDILNKKSGLKALTNSSGNMFDVLYLSGHKIEDPSFMPSKNLIKNKETFQEASLGLVVYIRQIQRYIGGFGAIMGGIDAVVFTGAIGSGSSVIRDMIMENLKFLKIKKIVVVKPDEERAIALKIANLQ